MSNELIAALCGAIVGSAITGLFGWLLPFLQEKRNMDQKRKLFTLAIVDDLKNSPALYEKIKNDWDKTGQIWFEYLIELKEQRKIYQKYPDNILLYPDLIRQAVFKYYLKSDKLIYLLESSQSRMQFLASEYANTIKVIKKSKPDITDEDARKEAIILLADEDKEVVRIRDLISTQLNQITDMSREAAEICEKVKVFSE